MLLPVYTVVGPPRSVAVFEHTVDADAIAMYDAGIPVLVLVSTGRPYRNGTGLRYS